MQRPGCFQEPTEDLARSRPLTSKKELTYQRLMKWALYFYGHETSLIERSSDKQRNCVGSPEPMDGACMVAPLEQLVAGAWRNRLFLFRRCRASLWRSPANSTSHSVSGITWSISYISHHVESGIVVQDAGRVRALPNRSKGSCILTKPSGVVMCVGGPALVYWVSPTEEELFKACQISILDMKIPLTTGSATTQNYKNGLLRTGSKSSKTLTTSSTSSRNTQSPTSQSGRQPLKTRLE